MPSNTNNPPSFDDILSNMILEYQKTSNISLSNTSDMYIKLKTLASQIFSLETKLRWVQNQAFPQTASGQYLDYHAQTRGLTRKTASRSSGVLTFSISSPSSTDIIIPINTVCFSPSSPDIKFSTLSEAIIKAGETSVDVQSQSLSEGYATNALAKTITNFCNFPQYVETVINKDGFEGGCDSESDDDLRKRLLENFKNISNGSNSAYYHNLVTNYDNVLSANIIPRNRGRGTVDIVIAAKNQDESLTQAIKHDLEAKKEINVDIDVYLAKPKKIDIDLSIEVNNAYSFEPISDNAQSIIKHYISNINVYQPFKLAILGSKILAIDGVENYKFNKPSKDIFPNKNEIIYLNNLSISKQ